VRGNDREKQLTNSSNPGSRRTSATNFSNSKDVSELRSGSAEDMLVVGCVLPDGGSEASCWVVGASGRDEGGIWADLEPELELARKMGGKRVMDGVRAVC
jgi:hypothetical protein